ncbi:MAG TPA: AMP-binding protein [Acidimicrobiales bacterium]|nr:AMP-binding protein [Acidimicrobiales bacterium]
MRPAARRPAARARAHWPPDESYPVRDTTVASILRDAAARAPDTVALVEGVPQTGDRRRWTYAALLGDAELAASALAARFEPGERIAAWAPSLPESLVLTYAAAMARLVLVPVNPALRSAELAHVLGQSGSVAVFFTAEHRGSDQGALLDALRPELPALRAVVDFAGWAGFCTDSSGSSTGVSPPGPDDVAQLVYTSGTTGSPKGALLTHRGMTNAARSGAERFGMRAGDVYVHTMPLFHVGGQVVAFQLCQSLATTVLVPAFEPGLVLDLVETERATLTCGVPTMLLAMVDHPDFARRDLSSLRAISGGGAVVPDELVVRIEETLGVQFAIVFGQTEASGFISQTHLDDEPHDKAATLGLPLGHVEARVTDPENGDVVAVGEVGELEVRGPNVMAGYHDLPEETAATLRPGGWLRTGDLVTMDERGFLTMTGRLKDMIVSGGENIYPVEIELLLAGHPAVAQAAVLGVPDPRWGETPVAVVRLAEGAEADAAGLESFLRERLAAHKVPRRFVFALAPFPLTASGKVQKFALRDHLAGQDSESAPTPS